MTNWADWYWLSYLGAVFGMFFPVELYAIFTPHKNNLTLSNTIWNWTDNVPSQAWNIGHWAWPHWLLTAFLVWLTLHLCFRVQPHWLLVFVLAGLGAYAAFKVTS